MSTRSYVDRAFVAFMRCRGLDAFALKALRKANDLLGLAIGARLAEMRENGEPFLTAASKADLVPATAQEESSVLLRLAEESLQIPTGNRPHYSPEARYRILRIKDILAFSRTEVARRFRVDVRTITRWQAESKVDPEKTTIGSLVKPQPPVRRYAYMVRSVVQTVALAGFGGHEQIASHLGRVGWRLSKRTIGRIRKEPRVKPRPPRVPRPKAAPTGRSVVARYPGHVLMMDITEIPALFKIMCLKLVLAIDLHSRFPLAAKVSLGEPSAPIVTVVFKDAIARHGAPPHLVTDRGAQFTASFFTDAVKAVGTRQRFGAVRHVGSIARLERLWSTLKEALRLRLHPPLTLEDCQRRVELSLTYYAYLRPHRALGGATPLPASVAAIRTGVPR